MGAAPLSSLLQGKPKTLKWNTEAQQASETLKKRFTTAPILCHSYPELQFVVDVDTSQSNPITTTR